MSRVKFALHRVFSLKMLSLRLSPCLLLILFVSIKLADSKARHRIEKRVVGGESARNGQFPYQASLRFKDQHFCGAAIIAPRHLLSAAHCFYGRNGKRIGVLSLTVIVGSVRLDRGGSLHRVKSVVPHPNFNQSQLWEHDIAVVALREDMVFDDAQVQPVGLPPRDPEEPFWMPTALQTLTYRLLGGIEGVVSGWSVKGCNSQELFDILQFVPVRIMARKVCAQRLASHGLALPGAQFCATGLRGPSSGVNRHDSGGPLAVGNRLLGITSWGQPCPNRPIPDVFTNVYRYRDFIEQQLRAS